MLRRLRSAGTDSAGTDSAGTAGDGDVAARVGSVSGAEGGADVVDLRWQMFLDRLGKDEAAFAQDTLREFRERLIRTDMDRRQLERIIEIARRTHAFDWRKLPKDSRVAIDSSPLEGHCYKRHVALDLDTNSSWRARYFRPIARSGRPRLASRPTSIGLAPSVGKAVGLATAAQWMNIFDLRRAAAVQNLETIDRRLTAAQGTTTRKAA